jgi:hypothetical protein
MPSSHISLHDYLDTVRVWDLPSSKEFRKPMAHLVANSNYLGTLEIVARNSFRDYF